MPITDLLDRVPFSPAPRASGEPANRHAGLGADARTFEIELPTVERVDSVDTPPLTSSPVPNAAEDETEAEAHDETEAPARVPRAASVMQWALSLPPLPSWGIVVIGGLSLLCLALAASLAVAVAEPDVVEAAPPAADTLPEPPSSPPDETVAALPAAPTETFSADPTPIPVELLTNLEQASDEPLDVELSRLLEALQFGFGRRSAQLDPTLRSYVYRMASRFEWNPDTFRVAVTAPDPALASARSALLERLFENAVAAGRLDIGTGTGPHALTLVTE